MEAQLNFYDTRASGNKRLAEIAAARYPIALLLDGLKRPRNIGALFRLADAARLQHIYFWACEMPRERAFSKVARHTDRFVPFTELRSTTALADVLARYTPVALEITNQSINYLDHHPTPPLLLIVGDEAKGVSDELLAMAACSVHLTMHGVNTSMNVANAAGIVVYHWLAQWGIR